MRSSFFDALMALCIPVMSEPDFEKFCPYNDVITYPVFVNIASPANSGNVVIYLNSTFDKDRALTRLQQLSEESSLPLAFAKLQCNFACTCNVSFFIEIRTFNNIEYG